jgi:ribosomal protein L11 methyltransferase
VKWLELSLAVDAEVAEAVADLLSQYAPRGVALEPLFDGRLQDENVPPPRGLCVRAYFPADEELETRRKKVEIGLWHLSQIRPMPQPTYQWIEDQNWAETWKAHYHPIPVGRSLIVQPSWIPLEPTSRKPILLDPGLAFGTGAHPTTRLCLAALEDYLRPDQIVIDLGCGSGILSIGAAVLGAGRVLALDIDREAVRVARGNVERNGMSGTVRVEEGGLEAVGQLRPHLLVANILAGVLTEMMAKGLAQSVRREGLLILSGILDTQSAGVLEAARLRGWEAMDIRQEDDWQALVLKENWPSQRGPVLNDKGNNRVGTTLPLLRGRCRAS